MKEIWGIYLMMGIITIPLTILLIVIIVQEILDLLFNKRKIEQLLVKADNISFVDIEQGILTYTDKLKSIDEWTQKELEIINKNRELDEREKKTWRKREMDAIYWERESLKKELVTINENYWLSRWKYQKTNKEINQELKFRKLFLPN